MGVGYIDDCVAISLTYITDFAYGFSVVNNTSIPITAEVDHAVMLQVSLRTLGGNTSAQNPSALNTGLPGMTGAR